MMYNLRTLTEKSTLGFGIFADLKVGKLIRTNPQYLIWLYFYRENIDYSKDMLKVLGLKGHTIKKPGVDPNYFNKNHKQLNCKPFTRKRYGIGNVEILNPRELQSLQRHGVKNIGIEGNWG